MALFGEKYGATVRTVTVCQPHTNCDERYSYELCGGTHVRSTSEIGPFLIVAEESSGAGVRRIEAITGEVAQNTLLQQWELIAEASVQLRTEPEHILERIQSLNSELDQASRTINGLQRESAQDAASVLLSKVHSVQGVSVLASEVETTNAELLGEMADWCRDKLKSGVVVLGSNIDGTARLIATVTPDLQAKGLHAGKLVGEIARLVDGGGGGNPRFASAGGKNPKDLPLAIKMVDDFVAEQLG
jgi:alanyl-tRNA synthetase